MSILFGHPTGNPNSHNAAAGYYEAGLLECICVSWMPTETTIDLLSSFGPLRPLAKRLGRRSFPPLSRAPKIQGRIAELCRLMMRGAGYDGNKLSDYGNHWLMRTMVRESRRSNVTAIHAYEDCSLWPFLEARRLGKACIYDMPTCFYPAWEIVKPELDRKYGEWLPSARFCGIDHARAEQKRQEMTLADVTLVASRYVESTIREFFPHKHIVRAPYGVDLEFWKEASTSKLPGPLRFIYAGQISLRKGVPFLIEAWSKAQLHDAQLLLVGSWALAERKRLALPPGIAWRPPCSSEALRELYRGSDVFVFPSFSDGFGMVLLEAMACGLPVIASEMSFGPEIITTQSGFLHPPGELESLVEHLRWFESHRDKILTMGQQARSQAARFTWTNYRKAITEAVSNLI